MTQRLPGSPAADPDALVRASVAVTIGHGLFSVLTWALADRLDRVYLVVSAALFVIGTGLLALGLWNGIQRSRTEEVTLTGLAAIDKSYVPARTRNILWAMTLVQTVVGVVFASLRPFTDQAFGLLVPLFGLGVTMLWASRFGVFHPRSDR